MADRQGTATGASMAGKVVVMTGATSGLGAEAADALARRGARLVVIARDAARADRLLDRLARSNPAVTPTRHLADLSSMAQAKRVAAAIADAEPRIDVLANNAGAMFHDRSVTPEGLERTFATNHMAYFVLTHGLKERLAATPGARVVSTSSAAHRLSAYDPGDVQMLARYNGWRAYGRSKLYNVLFTRELARRWAPLGVTANCFHPGVVSTRFGDAAGGWLSPLFKAIKIFAITPVKGARTLIHLASAPEVAGVTGQYFDRCRVVEPTAAAQDDAAAALLWAESLRLSELSD